LKRVFICPDFAYTNNQAIKIVEKVKEELSKRYKDEIIVALNGIDYEELMNGTQKKYFNNPMKFLAHSIDLMANADIVYFCYGWEKHNECKIERSCAARYGIDIIDEAKDSLR